MAKYTLEDILYGKKYNLERDVFGEVFKTDERRFNVEGIRKQFNMIDVKHERIVAKKMDGEGDCISNNEITIAF